MLQAQFADEGNIQGSLGRLLRAGYIQVQDRQLPGNFSYYQMTARGCAVIGLSPNKANAKKLRGIGQDIAALWFACMSDAPRKRLLTEELRTLFGAPKGGNVIYVAEDDEEEPTVYRLFVPEPDSNLDRYSTTLKKSAHKACGDTDLIRWIERGTYRFAVLLNNDARLAQLEDLIRKDEYPDLRIHLAVAPSPRDLPLFIPADKVSSS